MYISVQGVGAPVAAEGEGGSLLGVESGHCALHLAPTHPITTSPSLPLLPFPPFPLTPSPPHPLTPSPYHPAATLTRSIRRRRRLPSGGRARPSHSAPCSQNYYTHAKLLHTTHSHAENPNLSPTSSTKLFPARSGKA